MPSGGDQISPSFTKMDESVVATLYREGVDQILKQRKFLHIPPDTVFMAIDFYREFLITGGNFPKDSL